MDISIEHIIEVLGYLGIFGLMLANGVFSFPSSQILYIVSGYFVYIGTLGFLPVVLLGALGNTIGNYLLFLLSRKHGLTYITKLTLLPLSEIKKMQIVFRKRGPWFLFIGKLLPALKVFVPIVAGLASMRSVIFFPIVAVASAIWATFFVGIGYVFGKETEVFGAYAVVLFIVAFIVISIFYRFMNSRAVIDELAQAESREKDDKKE